MYIDMFIRIQADPTKSFEVLQIETDLMNMQTGYTQISLCIRKVYANNVDPD